MYQQPNHSYNSTDSLRRLSSNNPFRQHFDPPKQSNRSNPSVASSRKSSNFEEWVQSNKKLLELSSDEESFESVNMNLNFNHTSNSNSNGYASPQTEAFSKPMIPVQPTRADSDSSVNYSSNNRKMSSNNPFAAALNEPDSYVHRREPPPIPRHTNTHSPPARPPKPESIAPPSYEEVAGPEKVRSEYPREKQQSSSSRYHSSSSSKPHRSHSDSNRQHRHRPERSEKERRKNYHKSSRNKSPSKKQPEPVKAKNLDTIDKLDVTAFFGGGFHHDGPFDACTPHRNKNVKAAPVMAFPVDSPNNSIKGLSGNIDKNEQINLAFGNYEADQNEIVGRQLSIKRSDNQVPLIKTNKNSNDPSSTLYTPKQNPSVINFDANVLSEPIHGSTTAGLGSSTFLDGAPAPRNALQDDHLSTSNGGLSRKKSLVSRLRKNSHSEGISRRSSNEVSAQTSNNEGRRGSLGNGHYTENEGGATGSSLLRRVKSLKVKR